MRPESQKSFAAHCPSGLIWPSATECALQENRLPGVAAPVVAELVQEKTGDETVAGLSVG
jgi:hypothetical protein